ncbi:MAG: S1/P1 nuclease [Bryobacteraceae bacterium]|jgi:hypothetical protein
MRIALSLLVALPAFSGFAFGWGCEGHQMIALIARAHLTPAALAAVDRLLRGNPVDPSLNRFCKDRPNDSMADSATWADDARNIEKTAEWHFIDIPLAVHTGSVAEQQATKWCPPLSDGRPGCIVTAIDYEWTILRDSSQSAAARAKALRYLIHFLGDIAQPLHASDNHDRGGNCTSLKFFADEKPQNLHGIWDYALIARDLETNKATQSRSARRLDENLSSHWTDWGESKTDILGWAWESHKLAETVTYADLKPQIPTEAATAGLADQEGCNAERDKVAALHISIDDRYAAQAMPVIREQLAKAGYRLAGLLNQTFK